MKSLLNLIMLFILVKANCQCFEKVDAGHYFTMGIKSNHTLWAWGTNYNYEFGNGTTTGSLYPVQIGTDSNWTSIATGDNHSLGLKSDGTLWAWGQNYSGECGDGTTTTKTTPTQIGTDSDWRSISSRGSISFAIKNNGTLWAWGYNNVATLGLGFYSERQTTPTQVGTDNDWKEIIAGYDHTLAIKNDNTLWGWGSNLHGQLGNGVFLGNVLVPTQIGTESNWKTASPGHEHSAALKMDGTLWTWGDNAYGELGDGTTTAKNVPAQIGIETNWKSISADFGITYAIKNNGSLWVCGNNPNYEFGDGTVTNSVVPIQIGNDSDWNYLTSGLFHKVGIKNDNSIYLWGVNPNASLPEMPNYTVVTQFISPCTLSTNNFSNDSIAIFPNPANEIVNIISANNETINGVKIYDCTGKLVSSHLEQHEINVSNLATGVYVLSIETSNSIRKYKLIKS